MFLPCRPCCEQITCGLTDKPYASPDNADPWKPSGTWDTSVTWSNPSRVLGDDTILFFYGSASTSGGGSTTDWRNPCNWYAVSSTAMNSVQASPSIYLTHRSTRLPNASDVVHVYSTMEGSNMEFKTAYLWGEFSTNILADGSSITCSTAGHDSDGAEFLCLGGASGVISGDVHNSLFIRNGVLFGRVFNNVYAYGSTTVSTTENIYLYARDAIINGELHLHDTSSLEADQTSGFSGRIATVFGVTSCYDNATIRMGAYAKGGVELRGNSYASGFSANKGPWIETAVQLEDSSYIGRLTEVRNFISFYLYDTSELKEACFVSSGTGPVDFFDSSKYRFTALGAPGIDSSVGARFNGSSGSNFSSVFGGIREYCVTDGTPGGQYQPTCNTTAPTYASNPSTFGCG